MICYWEKFKVKLSRRFIDKLENKVNKELNKKLKLIYEGFKKSNKNS